MDAPQRYMPSDWPLHSCNSWLYDLYNMGPIAWHASHASHIQASWDFFTASQHCNVPTSKACAGRQAVHVPKALAWRAVQVHFGRLDFLISESKIQDCTQSTVMHARTHLEGMCW